MEARTSWASSTAGPLRHLALEATGSGQDALTLRGGLAEDLLLRSAAGLFEAGEPLLKRAQEAGVVRPDVTIGEVIQMVVGIAKIPASDPEQTLHILRVALDGLRYHADE